MKQEHINEIKGIIILALALILFASLLSFVPEDLPWFSSVVNHPIHNVIGKTGAYIGGILTFLFGLGSYGIAVFLFFWSWNIFASREIKFSFPKFICFFVLVSVISALFSITSGSDSAFQFQRAGIVGFIFADFLMKYWGLLGAYVILLMLGALCLIVTGEVLLTPIFLLLFEKIKSSLKAVATVRPVEKKQVQPAPRVFPGLIPKINVGRSAEKDKADIKPKKEDDKKRDENLDKLAEKVTGQVIKKEESNPKEQKPAKPQIHIAENKDTDDIEDDEPKIVGEYHLPSLDLLEDPPSIPTSVLQEGLINGAKLLEDTLASFGVSARVADIERGPAITRYELEPAAGVKVQKFTTLSDDIALAMRAPTVRIVAPIPGKNRVGIEVPNGASSAVFLKEVLSATKFRNSQSKLTLALGKDIGGESIIADLAEMPHLLIAGTTGSGKTVCVNAIIMSMLLNASPDEVKFLMVDPKMVELSQYNDIPHLLCPTITDAKKASAALNWIVTEMETRYNKLSKEQVRNIKGYNAKGHRMPYIVVIIDELADLMQVSAKTVESSITRIAQLSRAVGIHMILATQRPSVDVITGVIKANFPARVSFKVASKVDSRTVLDMNGAESLLGKGDMLFIQPGDAKPTRGQCSFVRDEEINRVMKFIKDQQTPIYNENIVQQQKGSAQGGSEEKDEYYDEAVRLVIETNQASVSIIQRRLRLGYTRAARLIDMMEQGGIVGPYVGSKAREILVDREQWLLDHMPKEESQENQSQPNQEQKL